MARRAEVKAAAGKPAETAQIVRTLTLACSLMPIAPKNSATSRCASTKLHRAVLAAPRQHPVQQVAGGDEVDPDQARARDVDDRRACRARCPSSSASAPMSPTAGPRARPCRPRPSAATSVSCDSWKLVETSLTTESGGCVVALVRAADADDAARRLPRRRRDLVGDAVVDRRLVELVGAVGHAQRVEAQLPVRRVGVAHAGRRGFLQHGEQPLAARASACRGPAASSCGTAPTGGRSPRRRSSAARPSRTPRAAASAAPASASRATPSASR